VCSRIYVFFVYNQTDNLFLTHSCSHSISLSSGEYGNDVSCTKDKDDTDNEDDQPSLYSMRPDDISSAFSVDSWDLSLNSTAHRGHAAEVAPAVIPDITPFARHDHNFFSSLANDDTLTHAPTVAGSADNREDTQDHQLLQDTDFSVEEHESSDDGSCDHFMIRTASMEEEDNFESLYASDFASLEEEIVHDSTVEDEEVTLGSNDSKALPLSPPPDVEHMMRNERYQTQRSLELAAESAGSVKSMDLSSKDTSTTPSIMKLLPLSIFHSNKGDKKKKSSSSSNGSGGGGGVVYDFTEFIDDDDLDSDDDLLTADVNYWSSADILTSLNMWATEADVDKEGHKHPTNLTTVNSNKGESVCSGSVGGDSSLQILLEQSESLVLQDNREQLAQLGSQEADEQLDLAYQEEQEEIRKQKELLCKKEKEEKEKEEEANRLKQIALRAVAAKEKARLATLSKEDYILEEVQRLKNVGNVSKQNTLLEQRRVEAYRQTEYSHRQARIDKVKQQVSDGVNRIKRKEIESEIIRKQNLNKFTQRAAVTVLSMAICTRRGVEEYVDVLLHHCVDSVALSLGSLPPNTTSVASHRPFTHSGRPTFRERYSEFASYSNRYQAGIGDDSTKSIAAVESTPNRSRNISLESGLIRPRDFQFDVPVISIMFPIVNFVVNVRSSPPPLASIHINFTVEYPEQHPLKIQMMFFIRVSEIGIIYKSERESEKECIDDEWSDNLSKEGDDESSGAFTIFENLDESSQEQLSLARSTSCSHPLVQESTSVIGTDSVPLSSRLGDESVSTYVNPDFFHDNESSSIVSDFKRLFEEDESDVFFSVIQSSHGEESLIVEQKQERPRIEFISKINNADSSNSEGGFSLSTSGNNSSTIVSDFKRQYEEDESISGPPSSVMPASHEEESLIEEQKQQRLKMKTISKINIANSSNSEEGGFSLPSSEMTSNVNSTNPSIDLGSHFSSFLASENGDDRSLPSSIQSPDGYFSHQAEEPDLFVQSNNNGNKNENDGNYHVIGDDNMQHIVPYNHQSYPEHQCDHQSSHSGVHSLQDIFLDSSEDRHHRQYRGPGHYEGPGEFEREDIYDDEDDSLYDEDNLFNEELMDASASLVSNLTFDTAMLGQTDHDDIDIGDAFHSQFGMILDAAEKERSEYLNDLEAKLSDRSLSVGKGNNNIFEGSEIMDLYSIDEGLDDDDLSRRRGDEMSLLLSDAILSKAREDDGKFRKQNRLNIRALRNVEIEEEKPPLSFQMKVKKNTKSKSKNNYLNSNKWVKNTASRKYCLKYTGVPEEVPGVTSVQAYYNASEKDDDEVDEREEYLKENQCPGAKDLPNWFLDY
jgi:hypothetical protein